MLTDLGSSVHSSNGLSKLILQLFLTARLWFSVAELSQNTELLGHESSDLIFLSSHFCVSNECYRSTYFSQPNLATGSDVADLGQMKPTSDSVGILVRSENYTGLMPANFFSQYLLEFT